MLIFLAINSLPNRRTSGGAELSATAMFPADMLRRSQTTFENGTLTRGKAAAWGTCGQSDFRRESPKTIRSAKTASSISAKTVPGTVVPQKTWIQN